MVTMHFLLSKRVNGHVKHTQLVSLLAAAIATAALPPRAQLNCSSPCSFLPSPSPCFFFFPKVSLSPQPVPPSFPKLLKNPIFIYLFLITFKLGNQLERRLNLEGLAALTQAMLCLQFLPRKLGFKDKGSSE